MACVPDHSSSGPGPQQYLNHLLTMIATLRGGESRFLPLIMAKIRDELPSVATQLPSTVVSQAATVPLVNGAAYGPPGGINGRIGMTGWNGVSGVVISGMNAALSGEAYIKQEIHSGSGSTSTSVSDTGSPFGTPPLMHWSYPLAQ